MSVPAVRQRTGVVSLVGGRNANEDVYWLCDDPGQPATASLAVADGMGGHQRGDLAARLAVSTATTVLCDEPQTPDGMRAAFAAADEAIRTHSHSKNGQVMGTTLTLVVVDAGQALVGHVGDTRAWLLREGRLQQITSDHSRVGELLASGAISERDAIAHPEANVLTQALGTGTFPEVDVYRVGVGPGDVLVISSDGLHGMVPREDIEAVLLATSDSWQTACERLGDLAIERGSTDNITVVAWQCPSAPAPAATVPPRRGRNGSLRRWPRRLLPSVRRRDR